MDCINDLIQQLSQPWNLLPNLNLSLPNIALPNIALPDINLPSLTLPDIKLPTVTLPDIQLPDISLLNGDHSLISADGELFNGDFGLGNDNTNGDIRLFSGEQGDNNIFTRGDTSLLSPGEFNPNASNLIGGTGNSTTVDGLLSNSGDPGLISGDGNTAPFMANTGDPGVISGDSNETPVLANSGDGNEVPVVSNTGEQHKPILSNEGTSNPEIFTASPTNSGDWIQNASDLIHEPNTNLSNNTDVPVHVEVAGGTTG